MGISITSKDQFSEEDFKKALEDRGRQIAVLLKASDLPDDIKESWIAVLPAMTIEQIDRFYFILEEKYLESGTKEIDKQFKTEFKKINDQVQVKYAKIDKEAGKQLDQLEKDLESIK